MVTLEPEDRYQLTYWTAIRDRIDQEWAQLVARQDVSEIDHFFYSHLMSQYGQLRSMANMNIEEILNGRVQWHRHELERMQARQQRLEQAQPGDILHHRRDGDFILRRRNKYHFRVEPCEGGSQRVLPQEDFIDATSASKPESPVPAVISPTLFDLSD